LISKLLKQGSHYASGTVLLSIASLISFPILTRFLPMNEYGILSLLSTILGLFVALNKFGLQQSVLRFFGSGNSSSSSSFNSSLFIMLMISIIFGSLLLNLMNYFYSYPLISEYFYILCLSAALQAYKSVILNCYVADQESIKVTFFNVIYKYLSLLLMLFCIFFIDYDALSVFYSIVISDIIFSLLLSIYWFNSFEWNSFDPAIMKKMILYGMPLMIVEFMQVSHAFIDRFIIEYFLNLESVAAYSAPYSIADIISNLIFGALATALVPIYMELWNKGRKAETEAFLTDVSNYFLLFLPIIITGTYVVSIPLMSILASDSYAESAYILPVALLGIAIFSSTFIYSAGLKFKYSQVRIILYVFESLVINIVLNILLVKDYGILASAISTVISYFWMSFRYFMASKKVLEIKFNVGYFFKGVAVSVFMYLILMEISSTDNNILDVLYLSLIGIFVSSIFLFLIDGNTRLLMLNLIAKKLVK
jgi:O-antigen/teichoic acid export membrane protein